MPHPPPNPDWPDHVKEIYARGCVRIDELRKQVGADGVVPIPFRCYVCDAARSDFGMLSGDGCPICDRCIGGLASSIGGARNKSSEV